MTRRVAIVGAGGISEIHGRLLRELPGVDVAAVCDHDLGRARALAAATGADGVFGDVESLVASGGVDAAHVLVPPDLHRHVVAPLLEAGIDVLCEKPLAPSARECHELVALARRTPARLGVNLNMTFDRVQRELVEVLASGRLGRLEHVSVQWNVPLPPLDAQRYGAWTMRAPHRAVLDQGVHPLSILCDLGGRAMRLRTLASAPRRLTDELAFVDTWQVALELERCPAQLLLAFGRTMQVVALTAIASDGVARADYVNGRLVLEERGPWELAARGASGLRQALSAGRQGLRAWMDAGLKPLGLRSDPDPFAVSMRASLERFHAALDVGDEAPLDSRHAPAFAAALTEACEEITHEVAAAWEASGRPVERRGGGVPDPDALPSCDVALVAGTGVIGRALVRSLLDAGRTVRVLARSTRHLPDHFRHERVQLLPGSAEREDDVRALVRGARGVVDLYYPTDGEDSEERMRAAAERIATACLEAGVRRLVYLSSTAALYLGDPREVVTGSTPPDPRGEDRTAYSRGKGVCERRLAELARERGLSVCILRPGIVVGEGGFPLHPGLGRFVNPQDCIGWGRGDNPMAFVLVEEVAQAIALALERPEAGGRTYNVVGVVPLSAREYVRELGRALDRPLRFHPVPIWRFHAVELAKWGLKRVAGRRDARPPRLRDTRSRAMLARFDTSDLQRELGWEPVRDRARFLERAVGVHGA